MKIHDESGPLSKEDMHGCTSTCEPFKSDDGEIGSNNVDGKGQEEVKLPYDETLQNPDVSFYLLHLCNSSFPNMYNKIYMYRYELFTVS